MSFTDSAVTPNFPEDKPRDLTKTYIEHTKGVWIRHNIESAEIELWRNGQLEAAWLGNAENGVIPAFLVVAIARECIDVGKRERSKEIRDLIGAK